MPRPVRQRTQGRRGATTLWSSMFDRLVYAGIGFVLGAILATVLWLLYEDRQPLPEW